MTELKLGDVVTFEGRPSLSWWKRLLVRLGLRKPPVRKLNLFIVTSTTSEHHLWD